MSSIENTKVATQTVWDTYDSEEEVYEALILPLEGAIAQRCKQLVGKRMQGSESYNFLSAWEDLFQEAVMLLHKRVCEEYVQEPKEGGVLWIPNSHVNSAIVDASRIILGANPKGVQAWKEFETSKNPIPKARLNFVNLGSQISKLEGLMRKLVEGGIVTEGEFTLEDLEVVLNWVSRNITPEERVGKPKELKERILGAGIEAMKEILFASEEGVIE